MSAIHKIRRDEEYENYFEPIQIGSGSLAYIDDSQGSPITIQQIIKAEMQKQLAPIVETQNALMSQFAETSIEIDTIKNEIRSLPNVLTENYQLKKKINNINTVLDFKKLPSNWNGNGAEQFSDKVVDSALKVLNSPLLKYQPDVFPTGRKSIQLEYEKSNGHYLEIEIFDGFFSAFRDLNGTEKEFPKIELEELLGLVNDFYSQI